MHQCRRSSPPVGRAITSLTRAAVVIILITASACGSFNAMSKKSPPFATRVTGPGLTTSTREASLDWSTPREFDSGIKGSGSGLYMAVSCPSTTLCVATAYGSEPTALYTNTDPFNGGRWEQTTFPWTISPGSPMFDGVSCPTVTFCAVIASGLHANEVLTSSNPSGGASAWTPTLLPPVSMPGGTLFDGFSDIDCPSSSMCVVYGSGAVEVTTNPSGNSENWKVDLLPNPSDTLDGQFRGVTCASASLCVAYGERGVIATSTNPGGTSPTWQTNTIVSDAGSIGRAGLAFSNDLIDGSCPSDNFCAVLDNEGDVVWSSDPTGAASEWSQADVGNDSWQLKNLSCPSASVCVVDGKGFSYSSSDPTGGLSTWVPDVGEVDGYVSALTCASTEFCVSFSGLDYQVGTRQTR